MVNGQKTFISGGMNADYFTTGVRTSGKTGSKARQFGPLLKDAVISFSWVFMLRRADALGCWPSVRAVKDLRVHHTQLNISWQETGFVPQKNQSLTGHLAASGATLERWAEHSATAVLPKQVG